MPIHPQIMYEKWMTEMDKCRIKMPYKYLNFEYILNLNRPITFQESWIFI